MGADPADHLAPPPRVLAMPMPGDATDLLHSVAQRNLKNNHDCGGRNHSVDLVPGSEALFNDPSLLKAN